MADCPICDLVALYSIGWKEATNGKDPIAAAIAANIESCGSVKFGELFRCVVCDLLWYMDEARTQLHRVPRSLTQRCIDWLKMDLLPAQIYIDRLAKIGGNGPDRYGNGSGAILVPCSVREKSAMFFEPAVAVIGKLPPVDERQTRVLLGNDFADIEPSQYALPREIRKATLAAGEVHWGIAPTSVIAPNGNCFYLNWSPLFFDFDGIKGCEIKLFTGGPDQNFNIPMAPNFSRTVTYIYFDWFTGCEGLAI